MTSIIPLSDIAPEAVDTLLDTAFGHDRHQRTAYRIRAGMAALERLCFAAVDDDGGELLGTIQCWPVGLHGQSGRPQPMIMVGPVAVAPQVQGEGIGQALMHAVLREIGNDQSLPLVMIGDAEYYDRFFGFSAARTQGWSVDGPYDPARLLVRHPDHLSLPDTGQLGPWTR